MNSLKRVCPVLLALCLVLTFSATAFAAEAGAREMDWENVPVIDDTADNSANR